MPTTCIVYRFEGNIPSGISVRRYGRLNVRVETTPPSWVDAINRLLRAKERLDPFDRNKTRQKRWNQGDLAEAAGVRPNTLSEILNGKREPSIDTLTKLATAFEVPLWAFFVSERQSSLLLDQQANDAVMQRRNTIKDEIGQMVAELLQPVAQKLTDAAMAKLAQPPETHEPKTKQSKNKRTA